MSYVIEFLNQTRVLGFFNESRVWVMSYGFCVRVSGFFSESRVWVMSYGFWVWVMKTEYGVIKTETPLNQIGPYWFCIFLLSVIYFSLSSPFGGKRTQ